MSNQDILTADILLQAYQLGFFPMAESVDSDEIYWYDPDPRGVLPIAAFHIPRRLKDRIKKQDYHIHVDRDFSQTMAKCAEITQTRKESWINQDLLDAYKDLHEKGFAHSVEVWQEDEMVGGIYGVHIGGVFCGESMFSRRRDMSKIALVHLTARLWHCGFEVFDTQFINNHIQQFGAYEISRGAYKKQLSQAVSKPCNFLGSDFDLCEVYSSEEELVSVFMQEMTQIS